MFKNKILYLVSGGREPVAFRNGGIPRGRMQILPLGRLRELVRAERNLTEKISRALARGILLTCFGIAGGAAMSVAFAASPAPVYNLSQGGYASPEQEPASTTENNSVTSDSNSDSNDNGVPSLPSVDTSGMTLSERVSRLEQQMNNLVQMNMPQQIAELQQQVQQLRGQLQDLGHQQDLAGQQQQQVEALPEAPPQLQTPPNPAIVKSSKAPADQLPASERSPNNPPQTDTEAYQQAFSLLADQKYDESAAAFKNYLRQHPDGQFVANAHYWLGDIYFQQKKFTQAELELNLVISQYASSGKAADASLKLAILHAQQGKTALARQELKAVMVQYPGTPAAQLAGVQLQQLNSAGQ